MKSVTDLTQSINELLIKLKQLKQTSDNEFQIKEICEEISLQYNNRGHLYYKLVEFELAVNDYTTAIQFNDKLAVAFYNRGTIHYRMNYFDKAVSDMKTAITLEPNNCEFQTGFEESFKQLKTNCDKNS